MNKTQARLAYLDLEPLIKRYAPLLNKISDGVYRGTCPFLQHSDNKPSFSIITEKGEKNGVWVCSCDNGMFPQFLMNILSVTFGQAMDLVKNQTEDYDTMLTYLLALVDDEDRELVHEYKKIKLAKNDQKVVDYLQKERYYDQLRAQKICEKYQMVVSADEIVNGWIVIPVYDEGKKVISWVAQDPSGRGKYNGGKTTGCLFNINHVVDRPWVIIVESFWCAIRLASYGFPAISTFGSRIDKYQSSTIMKKFNEIYLCYDQDEAGRSATEKAIEVLTPQTKVHLMNLSSGKDPDKSSYDEIRIAIENARRII